MLTQSKFTTLHRLAEMGGEFPGLGLMVNQGLRVSIRPTIGTPTIGSFIAELNDLPEDGETFAVILSSFADTPERAWSNLLGMLADGETERTSYRDGTRH